MVEIRVCVDYDWIHNHSNVACLSIGNHAKSMKCNVCEFETNDEVEIEQFHHSEDIDYCGACYEGMIV